MRKLFNSRPEESTPPQPSLPEPSARSQPVATFQPSGLDASGNGAVQRLLRAERERLSAIVQQMRQAPDWDALMSFTVTEVSKSLKADRVLIYWFETPEQGTVVAEAKGRAWTPALHEKLPATMFGLDQQSQYLNQATVELQADSSNASALTAYQAQLLERFQVKSSLAVPIMVGAELWGLLVAQYCARSHRWEETELNLLYQIGRELTPTIQAVEFQTRLKHQTDRSKTAIQMAAKVMDRIRRSLDVDTVFNVTTHELRQLLKADRVAVYKFLPDWSGVFVYESVGEGWVPIVGPGVRTVWEDTYLQDTKGGRYKYNETYTADDIYNAGLADCHIKILEEFQMLSCAIAPIFFGGELWGLLAAYQNTGPRHWEEVDVNCLAQVGAQFSIMLKQAEYLQQVISRTAQVETIAKVVDKVRKSLDLDTLFRTTTQEVRQALKADRVAVYQFNPDWSGTFVSESVGAGWRPLVGSGAQAVWEDSHLQETEGGLCRQHKTLSVNDIYNSGLTPCYIELLEQFECKAYIVTPVFHGDQLWGLLAAYQNAESHDWHSSEVDLMTQVGSQFEIALQQAEYLQQLTDATEQERAVAKVVDKIRKSLDLDTVFKITTQEVRQLLHADRAVVYRFNPDWSGTFVAESVAGGWNSVLGKGFSAEVGNCTSLTSLRPEGMPTDSREVWLPGSKEARSNRGGFSINDVEAMGFPRDYVDAMEMIGAKAYLMTAIFVRNQVWGMLALYQNSGPRQWKRSEEKLLYQIGVQFGIAIQQAEALEQVQAQAQQLIASAEREKAAKELLQQRAIQVLSAVRPAFMGDLTVRAPITEDEIGTISDAYNNTLQSLRKLVAQVKTSATNVSETSQNSESAILNLTSQAKYQYQELMSTLEQIQQMSKATEAVTANAQQVELAVKQANEIVQAGDTAMNRTVDGILEIRETVAETGKKIKRLSESSQKISRVVNLISNFTAQTQLLALNAAIEATRAGEYGRGFAVVADEVRSLARQSAAATTEIEKLVQEIQRETIDVAGAMEQGIQQVVDGTNRVNETRQTLNAIVSATTQISQLVEGITKASLAQAQQSQSVTQTMSDLAVVATKTSDGAAQISASFQELLKMAEALQASVGQFKVG